MRLLEVTGLKTVFESSRVGTIQTLEGMDLTLDEGEILGVVGETGAGKTVLLRTILGVLHPEERVEAGEVRFRGDVLPILDEEAMQPFRGSEISLILSGQRARLDPVRRIGDQLSGVMAAHAKVPKAQRLARAEELLRSVGMADVQHQLRAYPHELSGGMCQRVVIALGLANSPQLLMADEPTAGLDVTIQVQILDLFRKLVSETGAASILATRDLAQAAHYCDRIVVLRDGKVVETAAVGTFFAAPKEEHSRHLIKAALAARGEDEPADRAAAQVAAEGKPLLEVRDLVKHYRTSRHTVYAVNGVSFSIEPGRTLALVGESGSGKTTIGRCIAGLVDPTSGGIAVNGREVTHVSTRKRSEQPELETHVVFQEPRESLNPRWTLGTSIEEPLLGQKDLDKAARAKRVLGAGRAGRPAARHRGHLPAPDHRGRSAARRDRAGDRRQSQARRARRADVGARHVGQGADDRAVDQAAARARPLVPVHLARHDGREDDRPRHRDHVPRAAVRGRAGGRRLRPPDQPLRARAALLRPVPGPQAEARALPARGRDPERDQPAAGVRPGDPLPAGPAALLRGPAAARARRRAAALQRLCAQRRDRRRRRAGGAARAVRRGRLPVSG